MANKFDTLHLEITSKCALRCPACPRTIHEGKYKVTELSLPAIENLVAAPYRYRDVSLCGDHGDPIYHSRFHDVIRLLQRLEGGPEISVATNGSHRDRAWWRESAAVMRPQDEFIFGVDGLEDTLHHYRRNSQWSSLAEGISELKATGRCKIIWQWILFRFNEHQLGRARVIAKNLGVDSVRIILSSRYADDDSTLPSIGLSEAKRRFLGESHPSSLYA